MSRDDDYDYLFKGKKENKEVSKKKGREKLNRKPGQLFWLEIPVLVRPISWADLLVMSLISSQRVPSV